ncbi:hypothetical protein [Candidatus Halobonum tyrrellensis]|uniref:Yip1 domain-containing protein n=1 Tax=Candidatus Halobonum tyrrellensis G22 TaxID=1324957 RepID=V4HM39_9EURY|nr:hypothetical protein [Candidatus Halobonum tyrrellensis]ESP88994.1 hypothetical protein K933_06078 [Candidatus Halobonum tyrrellensis G22]
MERRASPGLADAVRIDLRRLHATWMELLFPRQLDPGRVVGRWRPETGPQRAAYLAWSVLGVPLLVLLYPLLLFGFATRFYAGRADSAATRLGVVGVVVTSLAAWGLLTVAAWLRRFPVGGLVAVGAAGAVATVAAALAVVCSRAGGRATSVLVAYPAGVTAFLLPPVVAALYSPALADVVFANSRTLAVWLLDTLLDYGGLNALIRARFDLRGLAYVAMWFAIAVPVGWLFGLLVALADVVRPTAAAASDGGG